MRPPQRISSYAALAAIIFQSEQNEMFGGQSVMDWEYAMLMVSAKLLENS